MKKRLFTSIGILLIAASVYFGAEYLLSFRKVSFVIDSSVSEITIYNSSDKKINSLSSSNNVRLRAGEYYIIPAGENIATDKISFKVNISDIAIDIQPPYSKDYLSSLLENNYSDIKESIAAKYPDLYPNYNLISGTLYGKGDWFGGLLAPKVSDPRDERDFYRIVLRKKGNQWEVIRRPEYILTSSRYNEVPIEILRQINLLVQ